jgi:hypothetical protein
MTDAFLFSFLIGVVSFYLFLYFPFLLFLFLTSAAYLTAKKILPDFIFLLGITYALKYAYQGILYQRQISCKRIFESYPVKTDKGLKQILRVTKASDMILVKD